MRALIYRIGTSIWNDDIFNKYDFLMKSQYWEIDELRKLQMEKLKLHLNTAYKKSYYYKKLYDSAGVRPEMIKSLEDIKCLPVVSKRDLLRNKSDIQFRTPGKILFC
jgi:phenylacetate-CoA ligase